MQSLAQARRICASVLLFRVVLGSIEDCTEMKSLLNEPVSNAESPVAFTGTCDATGRDYIPPKCQQWFVDVIFALRADTMYTIIREIASFLDGIVANCGEQSIIGLYMSATVNASGSCSFRCSLGTRSCEHAIYSYVTQLSTVTFSDNGLTIVKLFDKQADCAIEARKSRGHRGAAVFFITNIPYEEMCVELHDVITEQRRIIDRLNGLGYVFHLVYIDDSLNTTDSEAAQVKQLFDYCSIYADVIHVHYNLSDYVSRMYTCPLRRTISLAVILVMTLVLSGCLTAAVIACIVFHRRRKQAGDLMDAIGRRLSWLSRARIRDALNDESTGEALSYFKQTTRRNRWEISEKDLLIHEDEVLGKGAFAVVYKGTLRGKISTVRAFRSFTTATDHIDTDGNEVAVKALPPYVDCARYMDFFGEMELMKQLDHHPHIVSLIGCISDKCAPKIIMEYCARGDLLRFLRNNRATISLEENDTAPTSGNSWRLVNLISIAWQVCDGMCYLSSRNIIHCDVAARNILLTKNLVAKIGDFGLCRYANTISPIMCSRVPVKWLAIESLTRHQFTIKSDVWSFGVLLYEIFSLGESPFPGVEPIDMVEYLESGQRNEQPSKCPSELYDLMRACWHRDPEERPDFMQINTYLSESLEVHDENSGYLSLNDCDDGYVDLSDLRRLRRHNECTWNAQIFKL